MSKGERRNVLEHMLDELMRARRARDNAWSAQAMTQAYVLAEDLSDEEDETLSEAVDALYTATLDEDEESVQAALAQAKALARRKIGPRRRGKVRIFTASVERSAVLEARVNRALEDGYVLQSFHCTGNAAASYGDQDDLGCETLEAELVAVCIREEHRA